MHEILKKNREYQKLFNDTLRGTKFVDYNGKEYFLLGESKVNNFCVFFETYNSVEKITYNAIRKKELRIAEDQTNTFYTEW